MLIGMILACIAGLVAVYSATLSFGTSSNIIVQSASFVLGLGAVYLLNKIDYGLALCTGGNGGIGILHGIEADAGAGRILFPDEIHHFPVHIHIPPKVMFCSRCGS